LDRVIGLGSLGCAVAEELTAYPEYRVYKIDSETKERVSLSLGKFPDIKSYEEKVDTDEISVYLRSIKEEDDVLLIVEGGDPISGATLRILETLKDCSISVLYVCPDRFLASEVERRDDKIVFNILQEYARSGVLKNVYLTNKPSVEALAGDVSVQHYEKNISYFISYAVAMVNYFTHTKPILSTKSSPRNSCRIASYGVSSLDKSGPVNLLFPLQSITDVHFFYGIPKKQLEEDETLIKKIKEQVKNYKNSDEMTTSFSVCEVTLESPIVLCVAFSQEIQKFAFSE